MPARVPGTPSLIVVLALLAGAVPVSASEPPLLSSALRMATLESMRDGTLLDTDADGQAPVQDPFDAPVFDGIVGTFDLGSAIRQSFLMLTVQHSARMFQEKTRRELGGPFLRDYIRSVKGLGGWHDGDGPLINFVGHPIQGAVSGYVQIYNDGTGRGYEFGRNRAYWKSRMQAFAWSAAYSTQFELGPYSEASIGNVGLTPGTMGWVDLVVTPLGGLGMIVAEDAFDKKVLEKWERNGGPARARLLRTLLTPNRSLANLLRWELPWHRDTRVVPGGKADRSRRAAVPFVPAVPAGSAEWLVVPE